MSPAPRVRAAAVSGTLLQLLRGTSTRSCTSVFAEQTEHRRTEDTTCNVYASRWGDFKSPARRCSSALLLLAIASLLIACWRGGSGAVGGGGAVACATGPSPAVLQWDPVSDSILARYRVYYGTSPGTYLQRAREGLDAADAITYTVTNLSSGTTYYFAATAYDMSIPDKESFFSNEVCKTITESD